MMVSQPGQPKITMFFGGKPLSMVDVLGNPISLPVQAPGSRFHHPDIMLSHELTEMTSGRGSGATSYFKRVPAIVHIMVNDLIATGGY